MQKIIYILMFFLMSAYLSGQTFKQYKETSFHYLTTDKKLRGDITPNTYLKKGDTVLIISNLDKQRYLELFEIMPSLFDTIFKALPIKGFKNPKTDKFNPVLKKTRYKVHADICFPIIMSDGLKDVIWNISNTDHITGRNTHDMSIIFKIKNKTEDVTRIDNLEYIKIVEQK
jgi:hypothetical protein